MGLVIVVNRVRVENFAGVVGIISGFLQPNGEVVVVKPLGDEFGISAYFV